MKKAWNSNLLQEIQKGRNRNAGAAWVTGFSPQRHGIQIFRWRLVARRTWAHAELLHAQDWCTGLNRRVGKRSCFEIVLDCMTEKISIVLLEIGG